MHILTALGDTLTTMAESSVFSAQQARLVEYVRKLKAVRAGMADAVRRVQAMQGKLNTVRSQHASHSQALQQNGPFTYRCVWQGGVRYREYPRSDANASRTKMVAFGELVSVAERVYISGEALVFLHVRGVGWLFESKDGVPAMRLVPAPPATAAAAAAGEAQSASPPASVSVPTPPPTGSGRDGV